MTLDALVRVLAHSLSASKIPFMITGSVAAAFHGAGRATMDVDAVIDPTAAQLADLLHRLESAGLYVSHEAAREALSDRAMFNVIDSTTGWKADLIVRRRCNRPSVHRAVDRTAVRSRRVAVGTW